MVIQIGALKSEHHTMSSMYTAVSDGDYRSAAGPGCPDCQEALAACCCGKRCPQCDEYESECECECKDSDAIDEALDGLADAAEDYHYTGSSKDNAALHVALHVAIAAGATAEEIEDAEKRGVRSANTPPDPEPFDEE